MTGACFDDGLSNSLVMGTEQTLCKAQVASSLWVSGRRDRLASGKHYGAIMTVCLLSTEQGLAHSRHLVRLLEGFSWGSEGLL